MDDGNHVSTDEVVPGLVSPENGNGCTEGETELSETFVNKEVRGVNRWVSTRSSKGIPPKRYGDVVSSLISFWVNDIDE